MNASTGSIAIHFDTQVIEDRTISWTSSESGNLNVLHSVILDNSAEIIRIEHITPSTASAERCRACGIDLSERFFIDPFNEVKEEDAKEAPALIEDDLNEADGRSDDARTDEEANGLAAPCLNDFPAANDLDCTPGRLFKKDTEANAC